MFFYLNVLFVALCFFYCVTEARIKEKERKYVLAFLMMGFCVLMAFRPIGGKDTISYIRFYENLEINKSYSFNPLGKYNGMEYGFLYLVLLFKKIGFGYRTLFFAITLFNTIVSISCLHRMKNYILLKQDRGKELYGSTFVGYMAYIGVLYNGIAIRGGISISFSLLAIDFAMQKKKGAALACGIMGFLFQRVCVVLLAAALLSRVWSIRSKKQGVIIWWLQGFFLITNTGSYFLEGMGSLAGTIFARLGIGGFSGYLQGFDFSVGKIDVLIWLMIGLCILLYQNDKYYKFFMGIVLLGGWIVVFLHGVRGISRMYDYLIIFLIPVLSSRYDRFSYAGLNRVRLTGLGCVLVMSAIMLKLAFF